MTQKHETLFKNRVMNDLQRLSIIHPVWYEKIQQMAIRGTPDILVCLDGVFVAIELKVDGANPKDHERLQDHKLEQIRQAGGIGLKVTPQGWPQAIVRFTKFLEECKNGKIKNEKPRRSKLYPRDKKNPKRTIPKSEGRVQCYEAVQQIGAGSEERPGSSKKAN